MVILLISNDYHTVNTISVKIVNWFSQLYYQVASRHR